LKSYKFPSTRPATKLAAGSSKPVAESPTTPEGGHIATTATYELRPALWEDNPFLEELFAEVHAAEFSTFNLHPEAWAQFIALKFKAHRMARAADFPGADHSILWAGDHRIGELLLHETATEVRLLDLILLSPFRGAGIGSSIIEQLQTYARDRGLPLRLSIDPLNPAKRLFARLGFVDIAGPNMEWAAAPQVS
jgi:GNAT superfamily N-acetyltransferase